MPPQPGQESKKSSRTGASTKLALAERLEGGSTGCLGINCLIGIVTRLKLASCGRAVFPPGVMENYEWEK